ncbi:MAG: hypothetical protein AAFV19_14705 [Pseudomonadota bacterium]
MHVFDTASGEKIFGSASERYIEYADFSPFGRVVMALRRPGEFA